MKKKPIWDEFLSRQLDKAKQARQFRSFRVFDSFQPGYLLQGNNRILNLCANDYLGLAADITTKEEAKILSEIIPSGAGASRLVTGNLAIHAELEKLLAQWKGTESALIFPTGYQTNVGVISSLLKKGDAVFSDKLNHASIIDGCLLSGVAMHRYRHNNMDELEELLKQKRPQKRMIITDGVFSMDGDISNLKTLSKLSQKYNALLVIDDAHGSGTIGKKGCGSLSECGVPWDEHIIIIGTLSKAIGLQGGFVCATEKVTQYLTNYCRSLIYSTGLSPLLAGLAHVNVSRIMDEPHLLKQLHHNIKTVRHSFAKHGLTIPEGKTPIIPLILGESEKAITCAEELLKQNIAALAIRPPTVPEGTARLRLSISAAHDPEELKKAAKTIAACIAEYS